MFEVNSLYDIIWAIGATIFGVGMIVFRSKFLELNGKIYSFLYEKTNFSLFAHGARKMQSTELKIVVVIVGLLLSISGIGMILNAL